MQRLQQELKTQQINSEIKTSVLSTLVVEHYFSLARRISPVFTVRQYSHIGTRINYELLHHKSPQDRLHSLPSDSRKRVNTVYGDVDLEVSAPSLTKVKAKKTSEEKLLDNIIRKRIREIVSQIRAYKEPAKVNTIIVAISNISKVRGVLYNSKPFLYIGCPNPGCTKIYSRVEPLRTHLTLIHKVLI